MISTAGRQVSGSPGQPALPSDSLAPGPGWI